VELGRIQLLKLKNEHDKIVIIIRPETILRLKENKPLREKCRNEKIVAIRTPNRRLKPTKVMDA